MLRNFLFTFLKEKHTRKASDKNYKTFTLHVSPVRLLFFSERIAAPRDTVFLI